MYFTGVVAGGFDEDAPDICGLTATRVPFADSSGCLTDDADLVFTASSGAVVNRLNVGSTGVGAIFIGTSVADASITMLRTVQTKNAAGAVMALARFDGATLSDVAVSEVGFFDLFGTNASASAIAFTGAGAITAQRMLRLHDVTFSSDTASVTITDAAMIYVEAAPIASTNVTITSPWALWSDNGAVRVDVESIGATSVDADLGLLVVNNTAAGAGAQQYSPMLVLEGQGWKTDATAASQEVQFALQVVPIQGAASPNGELQFFGNINDQGFQKVMALAYSPDGAAGITGQLQLYRAAIGATSVDADVGYILINETDAAAGAQQHSPMLVLEGQGWETGGGSSDEVQFALQVVPIQGTAVSGELRFFANLNDGGFVQNMALLFDGTTGASGQLQVYRNGVAATAPADAAIGFRLENSTAGDGTTLQQSPLLVLEGQMFDGAASQEVQFALFVQPRSTGGAGGGNLNTTGLAAIDTQQQLRIAQNTADAGWANSLIIAADGSISPTTVAGTTPNGLPIVYGYGRVQSQRLIATSGAVSDNAAYQYLLVQTGALVGLTSYELVEFDLGAATTSFAAGGGTTATAFGVSIKGPAIAAVTDARTITDAASLYIDDSPDVGTNITITNSWALWVDDGAVRFDVEGVGATSADADLGLLIANNTDAAAGAQQYSPLLVLEGQGWKTNATAASQEVQFAMQVIPVEGAASPSGSLIFASNINDGGFVQRAVLSSIGAFTAGTLNATGTSVPVSTTTLNLVGATTTDSDIGVLVINSTAAAAGAQQYSPMLVLEGQGWKTNATAASQEVQFGIQAIPVEGAANPTGRLTFFSNINDGGFTTLLQIDSAVAADETSLWLLQGSLGAMRKVTLAADLAGQRYLQVATA